MRANILPVSRKMAEIDFQRNDSSTDEDSFDEAQFDSTCERALRSMMASSSEGGESSVPSAIDRIRGVAAAPRSSLASWLPPQWMSHWHMSQAKAKNSGWNSVWMAMFDATGDVSDKRDRVVPEIWHRLTNNLHAEYSESDEFDEEDSMSADEWGRMRRSSLLCEAPWSQRQRARAARLAFTTSKNDRLQNADSSMTSRDMYRKHARQALGKRLRRIRQAMLVDPDVQVPKVDPDVWKVDGGCRRWPRSPNTMQLLCTFLENANSALQIARRISAAMVGSISIAENQASPIAVASWFLSKSIAPAIASVIDGIKGCQDDKFTLEVLRISFITQPPTVSFDEGLISKLRVRMVAMGLRRLLDAARAILKGFKLSNTAQSTIPSTAS